MQKQENVSLKSLTTFGLDVKTKSLSVVKSEEELLELIGSTNETLTVLGGGSNILFTKDFEGHLVKNEIKGISSQEFGNDVFVSVGGGVVWHDLVMAMIQKGYAGVENMSLIPGTVGAAPVQNIGAYGVELKDVFESLEAIDLKSGEKRFFSKEECLFGYRDSVFKNEFKGRFLISKVVLKLQKEEDATIKVSYGAINDVLAEKGVATPKIKDVSDAVISIRQSKLPDPAKIGNAGSFFKNPEIAKSLYETVKSKFENIPCYPISEEIVKVPAGWLIDQAGWKGYTEGEFGVHKNQALVLVNYGNAKGSDIYNLALRIKKDVFEKFGVEINPEVNVW